MGRRAKARKEAGKIIERKISPAWTGSPSKAHVVVRVLIIKLTYHGHTASYPVLFGLISWYAHSYHEVRTMTGGRENTTAFRCFVDGRRVRWDLLQFVAFRRTDPDDGHRVEENLRVRFGEFARFSIVTSAFEKQALDVRT